MSEPATSSEPRRRLRRRVLAMIVLAAAAGAVAEPSTPDPASQLLPVDCLLPGKIRKLGRQVTYLTARQAQKTTALDCEIRGGEYVAYDRANYETALQVWKPQAEQGDAKAQNYVGEIYERGLGTAPDYAAAATWYRKAADQGFAPAQINLGQLLEQGLGVSKDVPAALALYRRASGLEQVNLPYVADVAPVPAPRDDAEAERARDEAARARAEAERARETAESARAEAERVRAEAEEAKAAAAKARADLALAREEQAKAIAEGSRDLEASRGEADLRAKEIAAREAELRAKETTLAGQKDEIERLRSEVDAERAAAKAAPPEPVVVARVEPPPAVELPAPTIHLIDPEVPVSRGPERVRMAKDVSERVLVGRVEAPGGLVALSVNGAETPVAENGIFRGNVRVVGDETLVSIVAVDRLGKRAERQIALVPDRPEARASAALPPPPPSPARPEIDFGKFHALVIGNDQYQRLPRLETAVKDAEAVADVLRRKYGFEVTLLRNANRYEILSALNKLRAELTEKDNLLLYYAGHGEIDEANMRGNWLPVDAEPDSTANWISNASLTDILNAMAARHVLVVADSCYSGALTRSSLARLERGMTDEARSAWQGKMAKGRSRTALTSGGIAPVLDGGGGEHSVFAKALLNVLERNGDVLEGQRLFSEMSALVTWAAEAQRFEQLPEYAPIKFAGHESGDFFFVPGS